MKYEYRCMACRKDFVLELAVTSKIEGRRHVGAKCPHCRSKNVQKLISRSHVHYKGTGFYTTDKDKK